MYDVKFDMDDFDLNAFREGDTEEMKKFSRFYFEQFMYYARLLIDDGSEKCRDAYHIAEHCFFKLWEDRFRMHSLNHIKRYLYQSIKFRAIHFLRAELRKKPYSWQIHHKIRLADRMWEQQAEKAELSFYNFRIIHCLPPLCYEVFKNVYLDYFPVRHTAKRLKISLNEVIDQIRLAAKLLPSGIFKIYEKYRADHFRELKKYIAP